MVILMDEKVQLDRLEIENFKSYRGNVVVGPLRSFTAVIGPNGSGKSNFMDAISFVFGEQARSLRVKKLHELIHGSNVNEPAASKCSVTAVLRIGDDGEEKKFQRLVKVSGNDATSECRIDGKTVSNKQYIETLQDHNIVIKPRNFLVFQGQVEQIATMNPKQRTIMLEKISGSGELKEDYERLEKELVEAESKVRNTFSNKREIAQEEKDAKDEKKLADDYEKHRKELAKEKCFLQLFELYHKEREMDDIKKEVRRHRQTAEQTESERKELEASFKAAKTRLAEKQKAMAQFEQEARLAEAKVAQMKPEHIAAAAKIEHLETKIKNEEKALETATTLQGKLSEEIERLEAEKVGVEEAKGEFEEGFSQTQESQQLSQLTPSQMTEYHRLKQEAARKMKDHTQEIEIVRREVKKDRDTLTVERQSLEDNSNELKQKRNEKDQQSTRADRMRNHLQTTGSEKDKLTGQLEELRDLTENTGPRIEEIQIRLNEIMQKFGEVRVDERELARKAKKQDVINKLQQLYGEEVLGRLIDLCHHSHERYQLAVTKMLGKHMNSIVVSTKQITSQCIAYMKQQEIEQEQFMPLDNLEVKPIQEHLRTRDPEVVKLVIDVIQITHPDKASVQKALKFACGSSVTCKDVPLAKSLAYGSERLQVVTWSGTLFDRGGMMSGGAAELKFKAKRWDEKDLAKLRVEQAELTEELRELIKRRRKEDEVHNIETKIAGLKNRMKYSEKDMVESENAVVELDKKIELLESMATKLQERVAAAETRLASSEKKMHDLEAKLNTLEDDVFEEFCQEIGVRNIRQYEAREESERQEREKKVLDFINQINKLTTRLTYEKQKLQQAIDKVEKVTKNLAKLRKDLQTTEVDVKEKEERVEKAEADLAELKEKRDGIKKSLEERESEADDMKKQLAGVTKSLTATNRLIAGEETKREQLRLDRRGILQSCKMNGIELPFERGSMEDVNVAMVSSSGDTSGESQESMSTQVAEEREANIKLDYSRLPERLKKQLDQTEHRKEAELLMTRVRDLEVSIEQLVKPKGNASEKLAEIKNKVRQTTHELDEARQKLSDLTDRFNRVKKERLQKFTDCLDTIANSIDQIYKELVNEESAQAFLNADEPELPFNGGIVFSLVVPGKNFRSIDSLSGGEKTLASLSLLFAIHAAHPSPFFIMDEIDAALDNTNILRVAQFMRKKSREEFQIVIISLKEEMYHHVDALVGIYPEPGDICISRNLTIDLNQYDRNRNEKTKK